MNDSCCRIRYGTLRPVPINPRRITETAGGILWSWLFAFVGSIFALQILGYGLYVIGMHQLLAKDSVVPEAPIMALLGPVLWVRHARSARNRASIARHRTRLRRLESMAARDDGPARLPHRCIEWALQDRNRGGLLRWHARKRRLARVLPRLPSGTVVVIGYSRSNRLPMPPLLDGPFEPIATNEHDRLAELERRAPKPITADATDAPEPTAGEQDNSPTSSAPAPAATWRRRWYEWVFNLGFWSLVLWLAWRYVLPFVVRAARGLYAIATADRRVRLIGLGIALWVGVLIFLSRILDRQGIWLVPGGLFTLQHPFSKKQPQIRYVTRNSSPLVIDLLHDRAHFVHDGTVLSLPTCDTQLGDTAILPAPNVLLRIWLAAAPSPGEEQVRSFLGYQ